MGKMDQQDLMVRQDRLDLPGQLEMMVPMEILVLLAKRVLKANLVKMVKMARTARQELQVNLETLELLGYQGLQVQKVLMALTVTVM